MAFDPAANTGPPLDEIQWRAPPEFDQGIHSNSVLYYFAQSPFFDKTSNNELVFGQGLNNPGMTQFLATRELFEGRLKTMSGLEFIVAQEPAETGPGAGTGVWVINKQTRRKRQGEEDKIEVHATYFIVGENIYMAPSLADIISSRIVRPRPHFAPGTRHQYL
jgi:mediator of RNA polymerase II transcription subunit 6